MIYAFDIVIEKDEKGKGYYARRPALPGCFSNARSRAAARRNICDAIKQHVMTLLEHGEPVPQRKGEIKVETVTVLVSE